MSKRVNNKRGKKNRNSNGNRITRTATEKIGRMRLVFPGFGARAYWFGEGLKNIAIDIEQARGLISQKNVVTRMPKWRVQ